MSRDNFSRQTLDTLAKRVGVKCSNPRCRQPTSGPRLATSEIINIGVGAHISAAASGGPRYDEAMTAEARSSIENAIWLCQNCAKLIDNDSERYTKETLIGWKNEAETAALTELVGCVVAAPSVQVAITYARNKIRSERHDYTLKVSLLNEGEVVPRLSHLDLVFPIEVLEAPESMGCFVADRSNRITSLFRVNLNEAPQLFPGDARVVLEIPYYMDGDLFSNRTRLFDFSVVATLYLADVRPVKSEVQFEQLQIF